MLIGDLLARKGTSIYTVEPKATLLSAVNKMVQHGIGSLIVMEGSVPVSIVTERDILNCVSNRFERFSELQVSQVMSKQLITCESSLSCPDAVDLMIHNATGHRIRHLPVVDGDILRGMISIGDLVETMLQEVKFENKLLKNYIRHWPETQEET